PGEKPNGPPTVNAIGISQLKSELVLHYSKQEIEDSLYFLDFRGYLRTHGLGIASPPMVYSLTQKAIDVLERGAFSEEEEMAFSEALFDLKNPGYFGLKFNVAEFWRRSKKRWKDRC
ncbi:MAG: hypothetical protein ACPGYT_00210, partial [Nitrospirales bacterium]